MQHQKQHKSTVRYRYTL